MPFPKDARRAGDVASELRGKPIDQFLDQDLLLMKVEFDESSSYGEIAVLYCVQKDDTEVTISTFSEVVVKQARKLLEHLPVIITPMKQKNYYTLY